MCPSFAFGTDVARGSVCPNFAFGTDVTRGSVCPSFAFGTDVARGSVSFGPNQGIVRKPNIAITRGKITRWRTRFECPSFAFGTDGARGLCVLASPLGPMAHAVPCLLGLTRGW